MFLKKPFSNYACTSQRHFKIKYHPIISHNSQLIATNVNGIKSMNFEHRRFFNNYKSKKNKISSSDAVLFCSHENCF